MMYLLFALMDIPVQAVLLSPVILWFVTAPIWHIWVIALGVALWGGLLGLVIHISLGNWRQDSTGFLPQGDWRWRRGMSAARYCANVRLLLHNFGWKGLSTERLEADSVTLVMEKDRLQVVMRCRRTQGAPTEQDVRDLAALKAARKAGLACLMLPRRASAAVIAAAAAHGVQVLELNKVPMIGALHGPAALPG